MKKSTRSIIHFISLVCLFVISQACNQSELSKPTLSYVQLENVLLSNSEVLSVKNSMGDSQTKVKNVIDNLNAEQKDRFSSIFKKYESIQEFQKSGTDSEKLAFHLPNNLIQLRSKWQLLQCSLGKRLHVGTQLLVLYSRL